MSKRKSFWSGISAAVIMLVLILDSKTALYGAREGIKLCLHTVVPSLFPFFVLSPIINSSIAGNDISFLRPLEMACGIPKGCSSLLLLGLFGGYPVGAQAIADAYRQGQISKGTAQRLIGFCNNAGPAFIFGMTATLFTSHVVPWIIWLIHITSAIIVGCLLPGKITECGVIALPKPMSATAVLEKAIKTTLLVCGWVLLFRVVISFCERWFLWLLPTWLIPIISGMLELTNGYCLMQKILSENLRFMLCSSLLSFGGLCVMMQTFSVTGSCGTGLYIPCKLLQTAISVILAYFLQFFLFESDQHVPPAALIIVSVSGIALIFLLHRKKTVAICR